MFTRVQNRYNNRIAKVIAINEALDLVEIEFEDDQSNKIITIGQLHKNWIDVNTQSENKPVGRPTLSPTQKKRNKIHRNQKERRQNVVDAFNHIHNKALESGMTFYTRKPNSYCYKVPGSTMVCMIVKPLIEQVIVDTRSILLGYPLADNDRFYHSDKYYYNRQLRIRKLTPALEKFVDKVIDTLGSQVIVIGRGTRPKNKNRVKKKDINKTKKLGRQTRKQIQARKEQEEKEN